MQVYDFSPATADGSVKPLSDYKGKALLIVNTATECGFTPQYADLQAMYKRLEGQAFEILDFPCNQFGGQAPGTIDEIHTFCSTRFGVTFPLFEKVEVNGPNESPLFAYLKKEKGFEGFDDAHPIASKLKELLSKNDPDYASKPDIKWNFTKFLIDREGRVAARFEPTHDMADVEARVRALL